MVFKSRPCALKFTGKLLKNRCSWKPPKLTESEWEVRGQYNVPFYKLPTQLLCTLHHKRLLLRTIYLWGHPLPWTALYKELLLLLLLLLLSCFSRVRLCDPIDSSPPGSAVPGILQARILEWVAISFSNLDGHENTSV